MPPSQTAPKSIVALQGGPIPRAAWPQHAWGREDTAAACGGREEPGPTAGQQAREDAVLPPLNALTRRRPPAPRRHPGRKTRPPADRNQVSALSGEWQLSTEIMNSEITKKVFISCIALSATLYFMGKKKSYSKLLL